MTFIYSIRYCIYISYLCLYGTGRIRHYKNQTIFEMYLACYTQEEIHEKLEIPENTIKDRIDILSTEKFLGTKSWKLSLYDDDEFQIPLYTVWAFAKKTNEVNHIAKFRNRKNATTSRYQLY